MSHTATGAAITFRVPVSFDLEAHFHGRDRDYAAYLLDKLHHHALMRRGDGWDFARLRRKILVKYIPERRLTGIWQKLEALGIIEIDHSYQAGVRPKGYRLNPQYVESREVVCRTVRLTVRIRAYRAECERSLLPVHRSLRSQFRWLQFDHRRAEEIIATMSPKTGSKLTADEYRTKLRESCKRFRRAKLGGLSVDKYGRVHTTLTNLPSALRRFLTIGGQHLIGIDLTSSQPLLAGIVAMRHHESADVRHRMLTRNFEDRSSPYVIQEIEAMRRQVSEIDAIRRQPSPYSHSNQPATEPLPIMCCISGNGASKIDVSDSCQVRSLPPDLVHYLQLCEEGQLYEYLMEPGDKRSKLKKQLFADVYYGEPRYPSELRDHFEQEFPTVADMLRALKRRNYRHPSRLMQSYESTLFIAVICDRITKERPDVPIYTIHDSVLTLPAYVEYVREVIVQEFGRIGIHPHLKEERYS